NINHLKYNQIAEKSKDMFSKPHIETAGSVAKTAEKEDFFCRDNVIKQQSVYENDKTNILYDYKPLTQLHFLIMPKEHREKFSNLTQKEYLEASRLRQLLIKHYHKSHPVVYVFSKNGLGQSVKHLHEHVVLVENETQDVFGKLLMLKK